MLLYGMAIGAGGAMWFYSHGGDVSKQAKEIESQRKQETKIREQGEIIEKAMKQYGNVIEYITAITHGPYINVSYDTNTSQYHFKMKEISCLARRCLKQAKNYLEAYNQYRILQALPTIYFQRKDSLNRFNVMEIEEIIIYTSDVKHQR